MHLGAVAVDGLDLPILFLRPILSLHFAEILARPPSVSLLSSPSRRLPRPRPPFGGVLARGARRACGSAIFAVGRTEGARRVMLPDRCGNARGVNTQANERERGAPLTLPPISFCGCSGEGDRIGNHRQFGPPARLFLPRRGEHDCQVSTAAEARQWRRFSRSLLRRKETRMI